MWKKLLALLSDAATYGASSAVSQIVGFLLLPIYTQYLSPKDYGVIAMLAVVTTLFSPIANLGIQNAIFRNFNRTKDEERRREVLSTGLLSVTGSAIVLLAICLVLAKPLTGLFIGDGSGVGLMQLSLVTAAMGTVGMIPFQVLRANRRVKTAAGLNVLKILLTSLITIWLVVVKKEGVVGVIVGSLIGESVLLTLQLFITLRSYRPQINFEVLKSMLAYGLPYVPHRLQGAGLQYFGQYVLAHSLSLEDAGVYNVAMKFATPVAFVVHSIQQAWGPQKFEIHAEEADPASVFRSITTYYFAATMYLWVGVSVWGPEVARLITHDRFDGAALLIPFVAAGPLAHGIRFMLGTGMEVVDDQRPVPLVSLAGLITVVVTSMLLVPRIGGIGAALAPILGWLVMAALIFYFAQKRFVVSYDWPALLWFTGVAVVCVAAGVFVQRHAIAVRVGLALVLSIGYPLIALLVLKRSDTERTRMELLFSKLVRRKKAA